MVKKLHYILSVTLSLSALLGPFAIFGTALADTPSINVTGNYSITTHYQGVNYMQDMSLTQNPMGMLTGHGSAMIRAHNYLWYLTSGSVSGNAIDFMANYTAPIDAVMPLTTMHVIGVIASSGHMSGTWSDNYLGGTRAGTWSAMPRTSTSTNATGTLVAQDFGVASYNSGHGMFKGYSAGFGLLNATMASATAVIVKLYGANNILLQTNTAVIPKFNADITGTQFSSPFDVSGAFNYANDGYWTNVRASQYGQSVPAMKVVATVTLANGKVVTAENTQLTGNPMTIYGPGTTTGTSTATSTPDGTLGGSVVSTSTTGALIVTSIDMVDTLASANGSFADGWKYVFHITAPMSESNIGMKFSDWMMAGGSSTIPILSNMRISSSQADNNGAAITLTGANTYSSPLLHMTSDLNSTQDGRQVEVTVEVAVPAGTLPGAYTTNYGVKSQP